MERITLLAIDLAKTVFQLHAVGQDGRPLLRKQLKRGEISLFVQQLPPCVVAMEACGGAFFWARKFREFGHEVRLISPQFVKPFVKSMKNDQNDAEAIAIAAQQSSMRFVPIKEEWQQGIQAVHRARELTLQNKIAAGNALAGLLFEFGIVLPRGSGSARLIRLATEELDRLDLDGNCIEAVTLLLENLRFLHDQVLAYDRIIDRLARSREDCKRLCKIEGVGAITATAVVGSTCPQAFKNGRQFAASLGLVPRQHSSGGKSTLLGISKRGDGYLRKMLIHGARAAIIAAARKDDARSKWVLKKVETRGRNKATVAFANKNARVIWVLLARKEEYRLAV
jgi:transposase